MEWLLERSKSENLGKKWQFTRSISIASGLKTYSAVPGKTNDEYANSHKQDWSHFKTFNAKTLSTKTVQSQYFWVYVWTKPLGFWEETDMFQEGSSSLSNQTRCVKQLLKLNAKINENTRHWKYTNLDRENRYIWVELTRASESSHSQNSFDSKLIRCTHRGWGFICSRHRWD